MKINTNTVWDISGDDVVEIHNESYTYEGVISESKGGGGGSCPPPDTTQQYQAPSEMNPNMMGGVASLAAPSNGYGTPMPPPPQAAGPGTNFGPGQAPAGGALAQTGGVQYTNPMDMMQTVPEQGDLITQYDPNNPYQNI